MHRDFRNATEDRPSAGKAQYSHRCRCELPLETLRTISRRAVLLLPLLACLSWRGMRGTRSFRHRTAPRPQAVSRPCMIKSTSSSSGSLHSTRISCKPQSGHLLHGPSSFRPHPPEEIKPSNEQFFDDRHVSPRILVAESGPHPIANLVKELGTGQELRFERGLACPEHAFSVNCVNDLLGGFHSLVNSHMN